MELKAQKWKPGTEDFVRHNVLAEYIQDAAVANGVQDDIEFNTRVDRVEKDGQKWKVHVSKIVDGGERGDILSSTEVRVVLKSRSCFRG